MPFGRVVNNTIVGGSSADSQVMQLAGSCTLRAAIEEAHARVGRQHIEVPNLGSYQLSLGQLEVTDTVTVEGIGKPVIDAQGASRVFSVLCIWSSCITI